MRPPPRPRRPEPRPKPRRDPEAGDTVYGLRASLAVLARRPDDILSVAYSRAVRGEAAELLRFATARGVPSRELSDDELARVADAKNHEGLCVLTRPRRWTSAAELADVLVKRKGAAIALDRVRNPYNVGAILRTAGFFGLDAVLLGAPAPDPGLARDAVRVAEGGAEHVLLSRTTDLADTLGRLRARGVRVVGADVATDTSAVGYRFERPTVVVVGNEREGMSDRVRAQCDARVTILGTGAVESLNVSIAASVLVAELVRARG